MRLKICLLLTLYCTATYSQQDSTSKFDLDNSVIDGLVSFLNDDFNNASKIWVKGLKKNQKNSTLSYLLTESYLSNNQVNEAQILASSNLTGLDNSYIKEAQVETFMRGKNYDLAINILKDLLKYDKENLGYNYRLAESYFENNELKECTSVLENFRKLYGFNTEASELLLKAYLKKGDKKKAINVSRELVEANPFELNYLDSFIKLCVENKELEIAENTLNSNVNNFILKNESISLLREIRAVSFVQEANLFSLEELKRIVEERPENVDNQKLVESSLKILEQMPEQKEARLTLILGYTGKKEYELALKSADLIITEDKANFNNWYVLLNALNEKGDFKSLEKYSNEALEYFPNQYEFWKFLGISQQKQGKNTEAIKSFEESLNLLYDSPSEKSKINLLLAESLKSIGEDQKAKEILDANK